MTEKRYSFNWERGHPQFWDNHCDLADCYLTCEDVCELLNKLHDKNKFLSDFRGFITMEHQKIKEENEQLKQQIQQLQHWNKCLAEKRHQELSYKPYTTSKSEKELKENLEIKQRKI